MLYTNKLHASLVLRLLCCTAPVRVHLITGLVPGCFVLVPEISIFGMCSMADQLILLFHFPVYNATAIEV